MCLLLRPVQWTALRFALALLVCWPASIAAQAQTGMRIKTPAPPAHTQPAQTQASIRGQITDPSDALVPGALVTLRSDKHAGRTAVSGQYGEFVFSSIPSGKYAFSVVAAGFREQQREINLKPGQQLTLAIRLEIEIAHQSISVSGDKLDSSPGRNLGAVVLSGSDLDALPSNSQDLKQLLTAMAGSDVSAQFFVDGFTADHLPPKSSILEIRMNQDPYSAAYDTPGAERIEIITKPGGSKLHGTVEMVGEDSSLNSRNPYVAQQPPYSDFYSQGDINGPLTRTSSWFLTAAQQNLGTQSFIHAITSTTGPAYTQTVSSPQTGTEFTPRVDFRAGGNQAFSIRYDFDHETQDNLLESQLSLPTQAMDTRRLEQTFRLTDTQTYSANLLNLTRFQYVRVNNRSLPHSTAPSVEVQGAFNGGGNNLGQLHDVQNHYELQDQVSLLHGNHLFRFGGRFREVQDSNSSTGGYNGQFIFSSIQDYEAGNASQFSITTGTPNVSVSVADLGLYFEDEWKLSPNMTLTPGLRYETQSGIPDHADFAPRVSYGWSIGATGDKPAKAVLRAGVGLFFERFGSGLVLNAARQNGILQQQYIVQNPGSYPNLPAPGELGSATLPTIYRIDPTLHAPALLQASIGLERQFSKRLFLHADYTYYRGIDLLLTRNINAPLPGTYNPADPASGVRPLGTPENIYEYQSEGSSRRDQLYMTGRYTTKPVLLYGYFAFGKRETNTDGAADFPSNQYNLRADYGRAANDIRARAYLGGLIQLPLRIALNPFFIVESSSPFNITTGQDLNGDSQFNDRPAFATDLSRPSVYRTRWGNFDADPMPGQTIIPINYGTGPAFVMMNGAISRDIYLGPKIEQPAPGKKDPPETARRFDLNVGLQFQNLFNTVNGGQPVGVLGSPLFGRSTNLSATRFSNVQSNRIFYLHMVLSF